MNFKTKNPMKKIYQTALFAMICNLAMAQSFFVPTTYRGAFEPGVPMWTESWTNWDPQNTVYGSGKTATDWTTASITTNTTWTSDKIYTIKQATYVKNGATLTIQPGTVILFDKTAIGAGLFITMGSKIIAKGTVSAPIVFTSNQAPGARALGDWGGIVLLGKAANNQVGGVAYIEGIAPTADTQFGGGLNPDDADNSGVLSYVRIEWAGYVYQQDKELNGITFGSVGSETTVDHIQVSFTNDDAFEWFGGKVSCKYLVSYRNLDDDFDTDYGYRGNVQFALSVRDPQIADQSSGSTSEGFESDNDASGSSNTPQTSAIFSNVTMVGPYRGSTSNIIDAKFRRGARIRRNSALKIYNSIFMDHNRGIHIDAAAAEANATNGTLKFMNNIVAGNAAGKVCERNTGSSFNIWAWFTSSKNDSLVSSAGILTNPYNFASPDYRPAVASLALTGANFTDSKIVDFVLEAPTVNSTVSYCVGAIANPLSATAEDGAKLWWYTSSTGGTGSEIAPTPNTSAAGATAYYVSQSTFYGDESLRDTIIVTVNALPIVTISANGSTSFCTGSSVILISSSAMGNKWSTNETNDSIVVTGSDAYTVTVTDENLCMATSSATIVNVSSAPKPTISGSTTFCEGDSITLMSSTADSYVWSNAKTAKSITVKTGGTYYVTTTNTNACNGSGQSADVIVTAKLLPTSVMGSVASQSGAVVTFANTSTGADSYTWDFGDDSGASVATPSHAYVANGKYVVKLTAFKGTCSKSYTFIDSLKVSVGIAEISGGSISIYPNPVNEQATFELNMTESANLTVNVYDIAGQLVASVYQGQINSGTTKLTLDTSNLRSGIYFTSITSDNAQKIVKMIVE
jgi:hypothetical protein